MTPLPPRGTPIDALICKKCGIKYLECTNCEDPECPQKLPVSTPDEEPT